MANFTPVSAAIGGALIGFSAVLLSCSLAASPASAGFLTASSTNKRATALGARPSSPA